MTTATRTRTASAAVSSIHVEAAEYRHAVALLKDPAGRGAAAIQQAEATVAAADPFVAAIEQLFAADEVHAAALTRIVDTKRYAEAHPANKKAATAHIEALQAVVPARDRLDRAKKALKPLLVLKPKQRFDHRGRRVHVDKTGAVHLSKAV